MAKEERTVYLYKITNPKGKVYIGQTLNLKLRFRVYERLAIPNQHKLRSSIAKYGWLNHKTEVIATLPESQANYAEKYLIGYYDSVREGLNIMFGGHVKLTKEMIKSRSEKLKGRKFSQEHKNKISVANKGKQNAKGFVRSEEFKNKLRKPILCFTKDGAFVKRYPAADFTLKDGFIPSCVAKVANPTHLGRKSHKGMIFKYEM